MKTLKLALTAIIFTILSSCSSVTGLKNMSECKFQFKSISNVKLGNIDLSNKKSYKSLKLGDIAVLMAGYAQKNLMFDMNVNMKVHNPNNQAAQLDGMDYILYIDDQQMLEGETKEKVRIEANSDNVITLPVEMNFYDAVKDQKLQTMAELAMNLATDDAEASRVKIAIKPFFTFGKDTLRFPSYITIGGNQIMPK